jgi:hypothetical protein
VPTSWLRRRLSSDSNADLDDVMIVKRVLAGAGLYRPPGGEDISPIPDAAMFDGIRTLQRNAGLRATGKVTPGDETDAAIIDIGERSRPFWCKVCDAPHGGVYPRWICHKCLEQRGLVPRDDRSDPSLRDPDEDPEPRRPHQTPPRPGGGRRR